MFPSTNTLVSEFSGRSSEFVPDTDLLVFTDSVFIKEKETQKFMAHNAICVGSGVSNFFNVVYIYKLM